MVIVPLPWRALFGTEVAGKVSVPVKLGEANVIPVSVPEKMGEANVIPEIVGLDNVTPVSVVTEPPNATDITSRDLLF
jgi:hypothetical protein